MNKKLISICLVTLLKIPASPATEEPLHPIPLDQNLAMHATREALDIANAKVLSLKDLIRKMEDEQYEAARRQSLNEAHPPMGGLPAAGFPIPAMGAPAIPARAVHPHGHPHADPVADPHVVPMAVVHPAYHPGARVDGHEPAAQEFSPYQRELLDQWRAGKIGPQAWKALGGENVRLAGAVVRGIRDWQGAIVDIYCLERFNFTFLIDGKVQKKPYKY